MVALCLVVVQGTEPSVSSSELLASYSERKVSLVSTELAWSSGRGEGVVICWKQSLLAAGGGGTVPVRTGVAHALRSLL